MPSPAPEVYVPPLKFEAEHFKWTHDPVFFTDRRRRDEMLQVHRQGMILGYGTRAPHYYQFQRRPTEKASPDELLLGVELEVKWRSPNRSDEITQNVYKNLPWSIGKFDGSVDGGYEIVTAPATFAYHKHNWRAFFRGENAPAKQLKGWSTDGQCGMHVHVSKRSLTPLVLGRMMVFINDPPNRKFVQRIAGRDFNGYCARFDAKVKDGLFKADAPRGTIYTPFQSPTVEIRIFRSNVAEAGFFKNLEFVHALVEYCRANSSLTPESFQKWTSSHDGSWRYPNLIAFMGNQSAPTGD